MCLIAAAPIVPTGLAAQEPDTVPRTPPPDTTRLRPVPPDTTARPLVRDSLGRERQRDRDRDQAEQDTVEAPPPVLPSLDPIGPAGWSRGVWEWDRTELMRLPDLSLVHLLERLPGVVPIRPDIVNQPEGAAVFGAAAGGVRYVVDGFELDPLDAPTFDPTRLPLLAFRRVRVERRVTGVTVWLETMSPDEPGSRSIIEAGTGDYEVNLFRGIFLSPGVLGGPLALGFERLGTRGVRPAGASNHLAGWLKWTWIRDGSGLQVEYRQSDMDRVGVGEPLVGTRTDWAVRGRTTLGPVTGEIYAGASKVDDEQETDILRTGSPHAGLRIRTELDGIVPLEALTAVRWRDHPLLPAAELEVGLRALPLSWLAVELETTRGWWSQDDGTGRWSARVQTAPILGVSAFGEVYEGGPLLSDGPALRLPSPDTLPLTVDRDGLRAGAEFAYRSLRLGAAAIRTAHDTVAGFGSPFEPTGLGATGGEATGFEVVADLPTGWDPLRVQGWFVGMDVPGGRLYMPEEHWRLGVVYHHLPLPSGNLEVFARVEHAFRGRMAAPVAVDPEVPQTPPTVGEVGAYRATNLELSIRVVTVRAFLRWENFLNRTQQEDLPGFRLPGQHALYGVKWEFRN